MEGNLFEPLKLFLEICKIPHPSNHGIELKKWLIQKAREFGAEVQEDSAGNLLCIKGEPKVCLQGHYDMVYVGDSKEFAIKPIIENGYISAEDSSLGADNGAALACMLLALRDFENIECLLTSDEEVGMIGANTLGLEIQAPFVINCDSEDINEVIFSCAGGYDLEAKKEFASQEIPQDYVSYEIKSKNFQGGHSGIEIHKNIPNAILELAKIAKDLEGIIVEFFGGEKRNSIPTNAILKIAFEKEKMNILEMLDKEYFTITPLERMKSGYRSGELIEAILGSANGVIQSDKNGVILSSNLGILRQEKGLFSLALMGRGNQEQLMQEGIQTNKKWLESLGFCVAVADYYAPWEREEGELVKLVFQIYQKYNQNTELKSIHAGLECGILKQKFPAKEFISIGPTILHPHSLKERMDLESFKKFWTILKEILQTKQ